MAAPCDTSWTAEAPVVIEPAHRPDRGSLYHLARRTVALAYARSRLSPLDLQVSAGSAAAPPMEAEKQVKEVPAARTLNVADRAQKSDPLDFLAALDAFLDSFESD